MEKILSFAQTTVGASHLSRDIVCQDSSFAADHEKYSFAAAADGHGSPCYLRTERGSKFAVECAAECVGEFLDGIENAAEVLADERQREELFNQLCAVSSHAGTTRQSRISGTSPLPRRSTAVSPRSSRPI